MNSDSPEADALTHRFVPPSVRIFPNVWPGEPLKVQPGDATQFVPMGMCFDGPVIMRAWDSLEGAFASGGYYSGKSHSFHPLLGAPLTEPGGGVIYFNSGKDKDAVSGALELMHPSLSKTDYAVFVSDAEEPQRQGYLTHCRIIPYGALYHFFGAYLEPDLRSPQSISMRDFIMGFINMNERHYGTGMCSALYGAMGGDGDWAKEELCFGFMVENEYVGICRIWSRAWLVTK